MKTTILYNRDGTVRQLLDPFCPAADLGRHVAVLDYVIRFGETARAVCTGCGNRVISYTNFWVTSTYLVREEPDWQELLT